MFRSIVIIVVTVSFVFLMVDGTDRMPVSSKSLSYKKSLVVIRVGSAFFSGLSINIVNAATNREKIASMTSNLPGMGSPDILYPTELKGIWTTTRNVTGFQSTKAPPDFLNNYQSGKRTFITSFVEHEGKIIKDRKASSVSEAAAYSIDNPSSITSEWDISNPNILAINYATKGKRILYQVSKRSLEQPPSQQKEAFVGYSEFGRIIESDIDSLRPPQVYMYRLLSRIKQVDENTFLGLERFYIYPKESIDDAAAASKPSVTIRSQLKLTK